ncbi:MAG: glycosyltransferase family 2 protein, partial [Pseudomonadota bacterium]
KGRWILEIDADERVTPALALEIRAAIESDPDCFFLIPVDNYIGTRLVRHGWGCHWGTSAVARLSKAGQKSWKSARLHPGVCLQGKPVRLHNPLIHYVDRNFSDQLARLDRYTAARARDLRAHPELDDGLFHHLRRLISRFVKCYYGRKGYREGLWGFTIALMAALYPLLSWLRARLEDDEGSVH